MSKPGLDSRFGFTIVRGSAPPHRNKCRFTCNRCPATIEVNQPDPLNPELAAKRAILKGWVADGYRASLARCPACSMGDAARRAGERPGPKPAAPAALKIIPKPAEGSPMADKPTPIMTPRAATTDERVRIRNLLDKHFDDGAGCYLDDYSDQRIAEECKVPRAIVTTIREAGWGAIRVDAEVVALKSELVTLQESLKKAETDATTILSALARQVNAMKDRIAALEAKRAA